MTTVAFGILLGWIGAPLFREYILLIYSCKITTSFQSTKISTKSLVPFSYLFMADMLPPLPSAVGLLTLGDFGSELGQRGFAHWANFCVMPFISNGHNTALFLLGGKVGSVFEGAV